MTTDTWKSGEMSAVVMKGVGEVAIETREIPGQLPGHVLIRVSYVGMCGTDLELFHGSNPFLTLGMQTYPFVFGHEWSGTVVAVGPGVERLEPGVRVVGTPIIACHECRFCREGHPNRCRDRVEIGLHGQKWGAAADFMRVPAETLTPVPDSLPLAQATLAEPIVTAVEALHRTGCSPGDRVAVLGTGTLGLAAVQLARAHGATTVDVIGIDPTGMALASKLGADRVLTPDEVPSDAYSVVVEASGSPAAIKATVGLLEPGGRATLIGIPGKAVDGFDSAALTLKDCALHGVLHGIHNYDRTLALLANRAIEGDKLIDAAIAPEAAQATFEDFAAGKSKSAPKTLIEFAGEVEI